MPVVGQAAHQRRIAAGGTVRLAVDEHERVVVEHAGAAVQADAAEGRLQALGRLEGHARLRLAEQFAERARERGGVAHQPRHRVGRERLQRCRNPPRRRRGRLTRMAVHAVAGWRLGRVEDALQHLTAEFLAARCAKADRAGHALALGDAVVAPTGRQVQHVARRQQPVVFGLEGLQNLQRHAGLEHRPANPADAPAPRAHGLEQEHIVRIDVRADTATIAGVRHHHVVEPRVGDEPKAVEQLPRGRPVQIEPLHQQRPAGLLQRRQRRPLERPLAQGPAAGPARDQARLDLVARSELEQLRTAHERCDRRHRLADQQRRLLPVAAHEGLRRQTAEQRGDEGDVHPLIVRWPTHRPGGPMR